MTPETSKHRFFRFLSPDVACAHKIVVIALSEGYHLGVLSSTPHAVWAKAAGGRLGVGNDPVYQKSLTFDPFPFPETAPAVRDRIADIAERIEVHRENALAREEAITMTGVYNVLEALHTGAELSPTERKIHEIAACGVLKDLHEELDALVAEAYGWPWPLEEEEILDRLVRLHDRRVMEEEQGKVRWLRPEFQIPRFGEDMVSGGELDLAVEELESEAQEGPRPWPESTVDQIAALKAAVEDTPGTAEEIRGRFDGAPPRLVERHLETLQIVGELRRGEDDTYRLPLGVEGAV